VISHTYVTPENRRKLEAMARHADVLALVPDLGADLAGVQRTAPAAHAGYEVVPLPVRGATDPGTRWLFRGSGPHWARFRPDIALVEQEAWAWALVQGLVLRRRHAPASALVVFAWESQRRLGWKGRAARVFHRLVARRAGAILAGNRDARDFFVAEGAAAERVFVMPQVGLDPERLRPLEADARAALRARRGLSAGTFAVGFAGRLLEEKGVLDLVDAVERLRHGGLDVRLDVIGAGPLGAVLERRAAAGAPLTLAAPVPREELAPFYQALDAFVLPSRTTPAWKEQFGMVLAEAMACGVAVVGSSSGAIPDVVGGAGLVFPEGDASALAHALGQLARDPALRADLGRRGRARSARLFSHEALADQTLRAALLAAGRGPGPSEQYCDTRE
jgi:glycosyltransferase involved in cell wall biosynthesis